MKNGCIGTNLTIQIPKQFDLTEFEKPVFSGPVE